MSGDAAVALFFSGALFGVVVTPPLLALFWNWGPRR